MTPNDALPFQIVVDANIVLKVWLWEDHHVELLEWLDQQMELSEEERYQWLAPDLLYTEVTNALWHLVLRDGGDMTPQEAKDILADMEKFSLLKPHPTRLLLPRALRLSLECGRGLSVYDACYVALAEQSQCSLVTSDQRMIHSIQHTPYASRVTSLADFLAMLAV